MAKYNDPDDFLDQTKVPWGSTDYGNPEQGKVDSLRKNAWAINRAVYKLLPEQIAGLEAKLDRIIKHLGI